MTTQTTSQTTTSTPSPLLTSLRRDGFVVIPHLLSQTQLASLLSASQYATSIARAGNWPHLRTLPKQFPPWPSDPTSGIWGVQHLLHPAMPNRSTFASLYFSPALLDPVKQLLELPATPAADDRLVMELFNLLVRPDADFALRWHRDAVPFDGVDRATEEQLLDLAPGKTGAEKRRRPWHAQYNVPLFPDSSLHVVPGSHLRARTPEEYAILQRDAYAESLPGMLEVKLQPGDVVFYDNNIIHRGVYSADVERLTLHGSVGDAAGGVGRARNVLQHAVGDWIDGCHFEALTGKERDRAERMRDRLVSMGSAAGEEGKRALHGD